MSSLLIELYSLEIPALMQIKAQEKYLEIFAKFFKTHNILFDNINIFTGPRRICIHITGLPLELAATEEEIKGPKIDARPEAIEGFCRSNNITQSQLVKKTIKDAEFFVYLKKNNQVRLKNFLTESLPEVILEYVWPKSMNWGAHSLRWVRPLNNILCIFDKEILPIKLGHLVANNTTYGHHFLYHNEAQVNDFEEYKSFLKASQVVLDQKKRKEIIIKQLQEKANELQVHLKQDEYLLDEVTGLVEYPFVMVGKIPEKFLKLPNEMLVSSMRLHQKYFAAFKEDGSFAPYFFFVSNIIPSPSPIATSSHFGICRAHLDKLGSARLTASASSDQLELENGIVVNGNEKVLSARLSDALYFYTQDSAKKLEDNLPKLEKIIFHEKLGSVLDKVNRLTSISSYLYPSDPFLADAAIVCKSDLVSEAVGEFPDLQGIMGYYYALGEGYWEIIAIAIRDHYKPLGPSDNVPTALAAKLALIDKMDSLVGLIIVEGVPSGSKDPYALRRFALGVIRIIIENQLQIDLKGLIEFILNLFTKSESTSILSFIEERAKHFFKNQYDVSLINAVLDFDSSTDLVLALNKLEALKIFMQTASGASLITSFKRINNILGNKEIKGNVDETLFTLLAENELFSKLAQVDQELAKIKDYQREDLINIFNMLSTLALPIANFFDKVMVNDDDPKIANNRLLLLEHIRRLFNKIARFDYL